MTITVGTKIKQVKVIDEYGFDYVGREFVITQENSKGYLAKGVSVGVGFGISKEELKEYFEVVVPVVEKKVETINNAKVIRSGKVTIVILEDGSKGVSKCLPEDTYDEKRGYEIAFTKATIKSLNKKLKALSK